MQANLRTLGSVAILGAFLLAGCAGTDGDETDTGPDPSAPFVSTAAGSSSPGKGPSYDPGLDPSDFVAVIDNPFLPMPVGARWTYEVEEETIEVVVLEETRVIQGVTATVVRDTVTEDGELVEDTFDWYAQDKDGNVWYLGEDTTEYEDGEPVSHAGAWEWGKDGALPGIVMWAHPQANGTPYYQEYYAGEAMDQAAVVAVGASVTIPLGTYTDTVTTREWNPLDGGSADDGYEVVHYAKGIGPIEKGHPGEPKETLVDYEMPAA